ncbi:MAG: hypothetical protein II164_06950, partial [Firmicutes bacterium]|nr:hypothetical protein [Bacillota bacterium]
MKTRRSIRNILVFGLVFAMIFSLLPGRSGTAAYASGGVQESDDLSNFLVNAVVSGVTQDDNGAYVVEEGKDYSIILSFAESTSYQFDNDGTLTYQLPAGIKVLMEQTGPLKINIIYKGRTYQVDAAFDLNEQGLLSIAFDHDDPDYPRLEESTNVSFRFRYYAQFDGTSTHIKFSDDVERDIVFDEPEPGQVFASKSAEYDEREGVFHYTVTVTATGDVTDVNVRDVISGNALIFNNDVEVTGNSSNYTSNSSTNGFDYTFESMAEGEEITITYSAKVDFSKDSDNDGKITADQTKNSVTVEPDPGDPHTSEYSREITYKYTVKKDGQESGTTESGDKIIDWEIEYNPLAIVSVRGDTITDRISADSADYMKYYGDGITVTAYDSSGDQAYTKTVSYSELTSHSDTSWTYTIPETDTSPLHYIIKYQTVVDMEKVNGGGVAVTINNTANDDGGSVYVAPEDGIAVHKEAVSFTTEEITWDSTLSIPHGGLSSATVTDYLPRIFFENDRYFDLLKEGSLEITGLLPGESYTVDYNSSAGMVTIVFFKDEAQSEAGLQPNESNRYVHVRLTTLVDQDWLQMGYEAEPDDAYKQNHTNSINLNGVSDTATVTFGKPDIDKIGATQDGVSFLYTIVIAGLNEEPLKIKDTFDTSILEIDTSMASNPEHMYIWGGNQWDQRTGKTPVSYSEAPDGIEFTVSNVPKQENGTYYSHYKIMYYLKLKDGVDLEQLAIANGGEYELINTAVWADHDTPYKYKVKYDSLTKELLNAGQLGGKDRTAQYKITFNSAKATLNDGEPMEMKDVLSSNLSLDYSSVQITTDPEGIAVPYSISGGKDENGDPDGTTVATYIVPDSTKVVITYTAMVSGNGLQKIVNKVSVNGDEEDVDDTADYGTADEGEGAIASFKIVKVDGYDANKKLSGVKFKIFADNPDLNFGSRAGNATEIELVTDENGEIVLDGEEYTFYFNVVYHVQEVEAAEDYGLVGFDYLVTLTSDMAEVDYGQFVYYFEDFMQIKNWPLEGLVVEKQVESDVPADKDRYYTFRVSILNDEGEVDTSYNEKNGDDQFENGVVEFQLKDREQKMFWGFAKGTKYKVEEIDADGFVTEVTYSVFDEEGNVTEVKTDRDTSHTGELTQENEVVIFKNTKQQFGSLKIKKNVTVNGEATTGTSADGTYTFTVKDAEGIVKATETITITNGVSSEVTVDNLIPGTYTVSEDTTDNPEGMSLVGENDIEVEVTADDTAEVPTAEFTNDKTEVGSLKIQKNVTINGEATTGTSADGTYTFTVKDAAGNVKTTKTITITDGVSSEVTVDNLI